MKSLLKEKLALYKALMSKPHNEWTNEDTELGICLVRDSELFSYMQRALDMIGRDVVVPRDARTLEMIDNLGSTKGREEKDRAFAKKETWLDE